jgi:hypothetical protein
MMQIGASGGIYGTLALMSDQQHAGLENPYYQQGTPFVLDRAGGGNFGMNIARPGTPPDGYYAGDKWLIQKRVKRYHYGDETDPANPYFIYDIVVRAEPKGYQTQPDERLDGDFYPGRFVASSGGFITQINNVAGTGSLYGNSFPTDPDGNMLYSSDPTNPLIGHDIYRDVETVLDPAVPYGAWAGQMYVVQDNPVTKPVITAIVPNFVYLDDPLFNPRLRRNKFKQPYLLGGDFNIFGDNFSNFDTKTNPIPDPVQYGDSLIPAGQEKPIKDLVVTSGYLMVGPYRTYVDQMNIDSIHFDLPSDILPGVYNVSLIGMDGQLAVVENGFTVYAQGLGN